MQLGNSKNGSVFEASAKHGFNGRGWFFPQPKSFTAEQQADAGNHSSFLGNLITAIWRKLTPASFVAIFQRMAYLGSVSAGTEQFPEEFRLYAASNQQIHYFWDTNSSSIIRQWGETEICWWKAEDIIQCPVNAAPRLQQWGALAADSFSCGAISSITTPNHIKATIVNLPEAMKNFQQTAPSQPLMQYIAEQVNATDTSLGIVPLLGANMTQGNGTQKPLSMQLLTDTQADAPKLTLLSPELDKQAPRIIATPVGQNYTLFATQPAPNSTQWNWGASKCIEPNQP